IITAQHIRAGGAVWADPVLDGYWFWYPPTNAILFSTISSLLHIDLFALYALSPSLLNWLFAAAFYCFVKQLFDGDHAFAFWTTLGLASLPWVVTYVIAFPTVMAHAAGLGMLVLYLYQRWTDWQPYGTLFASVFVGMMGLYHPPTAIILLLCLTLHRLWQRDLRGALFVVCIGLFLSSPYWIVQISSPVLNPDPIRYISPAMMQKSVVFPGFSPLMSSVFFLLVGVGAFVVKQRWRSLRMRLVMVLLGVSLLGQAPAYLLKILEIYAPALYQQYGHAVPVVVPHEFQLYSQVALLMIAGLGLKALWQSSALLKPVVRYAVLLCLVAWLGAMMVPLAKRSQAFCEPYRMKGEWAALVEFIQSHPDVVSGDAVICAPEDEVSFFVVGLRTGRKSLATYASHMNPRADYFARVVARNIILNTGVIDEVKRECQEYNVKYILAWRKKTSPERIELFQKSFETVYNDGNVYLFQTAP
ncbi:MAG: hypothetical protein P9L94_14750, partial [Candidatus Hinthialibacter antarcticus]|nr:hypothetical protein [Candidatus Hinthialibacter antarcticus]